MANVITSQTIVDGSRNVVIKWHVAADGTGEETDTAVIDVSALTPAASQLKLMELEATLVGCSAVLEWDATTDQPVVALPEGENVFYYRDIGGLTDPLATGTTGDLTITTVGLGANDSITLVMNCQKKALA